MEQLSYLQKISKILEPGAKVFNTGNETGWKQLQLDMNIVLPTDYKEYIKIYGTGLYLMIFLWVFKTLFCMNENINFYSKKEKV